MTDVLQVHPEHPDAAIIARAAACLNTGGLVAFPTETVYGLGAVALDRDAVRRVFAAKQRPANDPLIVHIASIEKAGPLVAAIPDAARTLASRFWPGPLTMVMQRSPRVPDEVTAGLNTVAIRVPSHPVARALIEAAGVPLAAPSANLFSRPSPTLATHVLADLGGRIDLILDGGQTHVGIESTVLDLSGPSARLLRPGAIDIESLRPYVPDIAVGMSGGQRTSASAPPSPGMLDKHYSPRTPMVLYTGDRATALRAMVRDAEQRASRGERIVALIYGEDVGEFNQPGIAVVELGAETNPTTVAARLYAALRDADQAAATVILARTLDAAHPLSAAINDRLRRASAQ